MTNEELDAIERDDACEEHHAALVAEVKRLRLAIPTVARRAVALACKDIANRDIRNLDVDDVVRRASET